MTIWLIVLAISIGCIVAGYLKLSDRTAKAAGSPRAAKNRVVEIDANIRTTPIVFEDFLEPLPETVPVLKKMRGSEGEAYAVNLAEVSCTCVNWESDRGRFAKGDIRRICKHLANAILKHDLLKPDFAWLLTGHLFPFPSKPYCAAVVSAASGQFTAIRYQGGDWVDVLADTGFKSRPFDRLGFNIAENRWPHDERAPNRKWIGPALCGWLGTSASTRYVPSPKMPAHSVEVRKAADEKSRQRHEEEAANPTRCFVCSYQMAPLKPQPKTQVRCPNCGNRNYVGSDGRLSNPERIALYAKFDRFDCRGRHFAALDKLRDDHKGRLASKEYRSTLAKLTTAQKTEADALYAEKSAAMAPVRQREKEMKRAFKATGRVG